MPCCAGFDLAVTPWPLTVKSTSISVFNVSLTAPPQAGQSVSVVLDSTDPRNLLSLSTCVLTFNTSNWNAPQSVFVIAKGITTRDTDRRVSLVVI